MAGRKVVLGRAGSFTIDGAPFCIVEMTASDSVELVKTMDTCSGGFMDKTPDSTDSKFTVKANYYGDPTLLPQLSAGTAIKNLVMGHKVGNAVVPAYSFADGWCTSRALASPVPGGVQFTFEGESTGPYQWGALPSVTPQKLEIPEPEAKAAKAKPADAPVS